MESFNITLKGPVAEQLQPIALVMYNYALAHLKHSGSLSLGCKESHN